MEVLWIVVAVVVSAVVSYGLRPRGTKQRKLPSEVPEWRDFARQHGLEYRATRLSGEYAGHGIDVSLQTRWVEQDHGGHYVVQTHYRVSVASLPALGVTHRTDNPIDMNAGPVRAQLHEVPLGNHAFDNAFFAFSADAEAVEFLRRRGVAETIIELRDREYVVELRDGELHALREEFVEDAEDLADDLDEVAAAAAVLQGDAHPGTFSSDPDVQRWQWAEERGLEYDAANHMIHGAKDGRNVKIHFGQRTPMTVVEASTACDLGIRTTAPVSTVLAINDAARKAVDSVADNGDEVHFLEVVRLRADRPLPLDDVEPRLDAVIRAAAALDGAAEPAW